MSATGSLNIFTVGSGGPYASKMKAQRAQETSLPFDCPVVGENDNIVLAVPLCESSKLENSNF